MDYMVLQKSIVIKFYCCCSNGFYTLVNHITTVDLHQNVSLYVYPLKFQTMPNINVINGQKFAGQTSIIVGDVIPCAGVNQW